MKVSHLKLKDRVLQIIADFPQIITDFQNEATNGARDLFNYLKQQINEEIYVFYINKCEIDFFNKYPFEQGEPYVKGFMESRYYIIRMFNISYAEYFDFISTHNDSKQNQINPNDKDKKISA